MIARVTDTMLTNNALAALDRQRSRLGDLQEQASTLLRINRPSDDPAGAARALLLRDGVRATERFQQVVTVTRGRVRAAESSLNGAANLLIRARELAVAARNDTQSAETRRLIATEVGELHQGLVAEANRRSSQAHVFGGYASGSAPFVVSGSFSTQPSAQASVAFVGDPNEIEVAVDEVTTVQATANGQRVFMGDGDGDGNPDAGRVDLFATLAELHRALADNDETSIGASLDAIDLGIDQISTERAAIGSLESQLDQWEVRLADRELILRENLSRLEDADAAEVFSALVAQETALRASLEAASRVVQPNLLQFLG
jgi:flagellar hook-associated protein 3 FlgL